MRPVWIFPEPLPADLPRFHQDELLHAILARRLEDPALVDDFLDQRPRESPDPHCLPGMTEAVERIIAAVRGKEPIGIFGDYDTDGVTSAALLTQALRAASGGMQPAAVRLPSRAEGYGLSVAGVDDLAAAGARLLIAVDCGSKDHVAVARALEHGMDVVIIDHHRIIDEPPTGAIIASAQLAPSSPYQPLSAAGLSYLLATALARAGLETGAGGGKEPFALLDLAMIGLVGDVSPLTGLNRTLVRDGLRQLRAQPRPGLRELGDAGGIDLSTISSTGVAFQLSPRLNAPGRLGDPRPAYDLLTTTNRAEARRLAAVTEQANAQRRALQTRILREIEELLLREPYRLEQRVLVFTGENWESGIVGLAASKLAEQFSRPVIVLTLDDGVAHGSARSVPGFDITAALARCGELLIRHGGHERAAGLALSTRRVADLDAALQEAIAASGAPLPGPPRLEIDANLEPERLTVETAQLIQALGPFGEGNPVPLLHVPAAPLRGYTTMGRERQHLKLHVGSGGAGTTAILWNGAARSRELVGGRTVDIVGRLEMNTYQGVTRPQFRIVDFRVSGD